MKNDDVNFFIAFFGIIAGIIMAVYSSYISFVNTAGYDPSQSVDSVLYFFGMIIGNLIIPSILLLLVFVICLLFKKKPNYYYALAIILVVYESLYLKGILYSIK